MGTIQLTLLLASLVVTLTASTVIFVEKIPKIVEVGQGKYFMVINEDQTSQQFIKDYSRGYISSKDYSKGFNPKNDYIPSVLPPSKDYSKGFNPKKE